MKIINCSFIEKGSNMKNKKWIKRYKSIVLAFVFSTFLLTGCGKEKDEIIASTTDTTEVVSTTEAATDMDAAVEEGNTIGTKLRSMFMTEIKNDQNIESIADKLSKHEVLKDQNMVTQPVTEGFLNGFDAEITGFKNGVMFSPMIGSIPFVGYVFETDNSYELVKTLKDHAQLNWNICTVADEMVVDSDGSYVFFVMAPKSFE